MNAATLLFAAAAQPLRLVTGNEPGPLLERVPTAVWIAIAGGLVLVAAILIVRFIGRDRSETAEAERAYDALARSLGVRKEERRVLRKAARAAELAPVACVLSHSAFDVALSGAPAEERSELARLRASLFPEAMPVA